MKRRCIFTLFKSNFATYLFIFPFADDSNMNWHGVENIDCILFLLLFLCYLLSCSFSHSASMVIDIAWLSLGVVWLIKFYMTVETGEAREIMLGKWISLFAISLSGNVYYESAMKKKTETNTKKHRNYFICTHISKSLCIFIGLVICNWAVLLSMLITIWCTFDAAGRSWVKMKKYQRSMRESESRFNYKRSGSMNRNWRQRSVIA